MSSKKSDISDKKSNIHRNIGKRIRFLRKDVLRLNQASFAYKFKISSGMVSDYENGKHPQPIHLLIDLSRETGYDLKWISTGEGVKKYSDSIEATGFKVKDELLREYGKSVASDEKMWEIIDYLHEDEDFKKIIWHLIIAKKGLGKLI